MILNKSSSDYRADIDGLRAIAILGVIIFHTFPKLIQGGFVGVDIFFVISGYLISTIILKNLAEGNFSFYHFYYRRIRRIFPALSLILIFAITFGWFVLLPSEYQQLGKYIVSGVGFVSNFTAWQEFGYFDKIAEIKPLLHLWSLGIEEQFYILFPAILYLSWKRNVNLLSVIFLLALISFI
jgi:peptidoglycan/LPS O-acetylase OafA/YrhL